ncbi:hypothetical protein [Mycobacterium sp. Z3061]|uniref:hypothetical protein n=1 Tax=Mycobacterium sp. Z3061 TaxID=3073562 RepID=UPI0028738DD6|nr:hypothetical protein [Mycobacterium sp. Z3061]
MAVAPETNVIALQSHHRWRAARRQAVEVDAAIRRHPSSWREGAVAAKALSSVPGSAR